MEFFQITDVIGSATSPFIVKDWKMVFESSAFNTMGSLSIIGFLLQFLHQETKGITFPGTIAIPETEADMENEKLTSNLNGSFGED